MKHVYKSLLIIIFFYSVSWGQVQFSEQAQALGCVNSSYGIGALGGGISFFDFDNDGWDDITVSSEEGEPVRFFKNSHGSFNELLLNFGDELFETKTVQWVDFDNDSDYDLFVTSNVDSNRLYENNGDFSFVDKTIPAGLLVTNHKTFGGSWGDYNNDGWLDLFICSRDDGSLVVSNILFRNNQDGTFTNVSSDAGLTDINQTSFCSAFFDYNNDGWQDIYIANDRSPENILYKNNGDNTFTNVGMSSGTNIVMDAMSTSIGDYNNDGWLDIYITNTHNGNVFYKNNGDGTFTDIALENGTLMESVAWGAVFLDAENDSDLDLYVSGMLDGTSGTLPSAFYENNGSGLYTIPVGAGFENDTAKSFSNAIGDIDNDGYPDITVLNYDPDNIYLWENISPKTNNWIKVKLEGVVSNRQGIGSWIEIAVDGEKQYNYTLCGEGYLGQNSGYEFFGIGDATSIDYLKITWLSGTVDMITNPTINEHHTIVEGTFLAIEEESIVLEEISVFPNPGSLLTIKYPQKYAPLSLYVTDIKGRIILQKKEIISMERVDFKHYPKGIYFFIFENERNRITKKIIVN